MRLEFHFLFASDLEDAASYYETCEPGLDLGDRFIAAVEEAIALIEQHPLAGSYIYRPRAIRHIVLRKFPYAVHYKVISLDHVCITGLYHAARDPEVWLERL